MSLSKEKRKMLKLTAVMSFSAVVGRLLSIPSSIVTAKFLGPSLLGTLAVINLIIQYAGYSHLGLLQSLSRDVPIAYGRGDKKEAKIITDTVYTGFFFASAGAIFVLWVLFIFGFSFKGALDIWILVLISLILVANRADTFLRTYIKAEGRFMIIGKLEFITKFISPGLGIPAVIFFRLKGAIFVMFLIHVMDIVYYIICLKRPRFRFYFEFRKTLGLLKTGFMIFINKISESLFWGVDLMIIAAMMTTRDVGLYSIALAGMMIGAPFSQAINMTVYRNMMVDGGRFGMAPGKRFQKYFEGNFVIYLLFNSLLLGLGILIYMLLIRTILVKYTESLPIMIILGFGYMIYTSRIFLSIYMNVTNQLQKRLGIIMFGLGINALMDYLAIFWGYGKIGVACACSASFILIAASIIIVSLRQIYNSIIAALLFLLKIVMIAVILTGVIFVSYQWNVFDYAYLPSIYSKLLWGTVDLMVKGLIFSTVCFVLFLSFFRKYRLMEQLKPIISYSWSSVVKRLNVRKNSVEGIVS